MASKYASNHSRDDLSEASSERLSDLLSESSDEALLGAKTPRDSLKGKKGGKSFASPHGPTSGGALNPPIRHRERVDSAVLILIDQRARKSHQPFVAPEHFPPSRPSRDVLHWEPGACPHQKISNVKDLKNLLHNELRRGSGGGGGGGLHEKNISPFARGSRLAMPPRHSTLHSQCNSRRGSINDEPFEHHELHEAPDPLKHHSMTRRESRGPVLPDQGNRRSLTPDALKAGKMMASNDRGRRSSDVFHLMRSSLKKDGTKGEGHNEKKCFVKMLIASTSGKLDQASMLSQHAVHVKRVISRSKDMQVEVYEKLTSYEMEGNHRKHPAAKERLRQKATNRMRHTRQMLIQSRLAKGTGSPQGASGLGNVNAAMCTSVSTPSSRREWKTASTLESMPSGMSLLGAVTEEVDHHRKAVPHHCPHRGSAESSRAVTPRHSGVPPLNTSERAQTPRCSAVPVNTSSEHEAPPPIAHTSTCPTRAASRRNSVMEPIAPDQLANLEQLSHSHVPTKWWKQIEVPRLRSRFRAEHDQQILSGNFVDEFKSRRRIFRIWAAELTLNPEDVDSMDVYKSDRSDLEAQAVREYMARRDLAAQKIQTQWTYKKLRTKRIARRQEEVRAVIKLQRMWMLKQNYHLPMKRRMQERVKKVVLLQNLQATFRGFVCRKNLQSVKELRSMEKGLVDLQTHLGVPPIHILVRLQSAVRGFLARKRAREKAISEAAKLVLSPREELSPSVDDPIGQRDLCRSRTPSGRPSTGFHSRTSSKSISSSIGRRSSMAVGKDLASKLLLKSGRESARASVVATPCDGDKAADGTLSLSSTRASTRISLRSNLSLPGANRNSNSLSPSAMASGLMVPGLAVPAQLMTPGLVTPRNRLSILCDDSLMEHQSDFAHLPMRSCPLQSTLGAAKEVESPDCDDWAPETTARARSSVEDVIEMNIPARPHTSCSMRPHRVSTTAHRLGSICSRQVAIPFEPTAPLQPVRASTTFVRSTLKRAQTIKAAED